MPDPIAPVPGTRPAVFLDRDGTLGGDGDHCHPDDFSIYPFVPEAVRLLNDAGLPVYVFTMQGRIAEGVWTDAQFVARMERMQAELAAGAGARLDGWYWCPHEWGSGCECGKPGPGMLLRAAQEHGLDLASSWVVGDNTISDIAAAQAAGCRSILVRTGWGAGPPAEYLDRWESAEADHVVDDVLAAAHLIVATGRPVTPPE